jgi:acyl carrier protein
MSENVQDRVLRIVETARQKPPGSISPDSSFEELGIDSLDRLNLLFDLEGEFDIQIDDEQAKTVTTLRQMIDGIQMLVNQKDQKQSAQAS